MDTQYQQAALDVAMDIQRMRESLGKQSAMIKPAGIEKAKAERAYDEAIARQIAFMQMGETIVVDGKELNKLPATVQKDIAKGLCGEELERKITADTGYKATITTLEATQTAMSAMQSVLRNFDVI